jgi:hypothetical protein
MPAFRVHPKFSLRIAKIWDASCIYILFLSGKPIQAMKPRKFYVFVQAEWRFFALLYFNKNVSE